MENETIYDRLLQARQAVIEAQQIKDNELVGLIEQDLVDNTKKTLEFVVKGLFDLACNPYQDVISDRFGCTKVNCKEHLYKKYCIDSRSQIWESLPNSEDIYAINTYEKSDTEQHNWQLFLASRLIELLQRNGIEVLHNDLGCSEVQMKILAKLPTIQDELNQTKTYDLK